MYDKPTASLIRQAPALAGLDLDELPEQLSKSFAEIAAARLRLRSEDFADGELLELIHYMRRLAFTNEAMVTLAPDRDNRIAAAFVAATAHQLALNASHIRVEDKLAAYLRPNSVSSDISAMLLFLIAEATADASEIANRLRWPNANPVEGSLLAALKALANGELTKINAESMPSRADVMQEYIGDTAAMALYFYILEGVHSLAVSMLSGTPIDEAVAIFQKVIDISSAPNVADTEIGPIIAGEIGVFPGPSHLASLLISAARDLSASSVTAIPPPTGVDANKWRASMKRIAKKRPYLWRNHRHAIEEKYLEPGFSAAVGFPTGAGKSTLAELKVNAALLRNLGVVFLAPTHALVDQTMQSLRQSFPKARVQNERFDELNSSEEDLPDIFVMTPEACLAQMSVDPGVFENVGLLIFDECHLLHPDDGSTDRRAIDAMLCILNFSLLAPDADLLLLSAMMKNTDEIAGWISAMTSRPCLPLSMAWKPTRQLRGSVVYDLKKILALGNGLQTAHQTGKTKAPSTADKNKLQALPLALFSLKQTWETKSRTDYALVQLLQNEITLSANKFWGITPNSGTVACAIAAAASETDIKTLIFYQTIRNAASAIEKLDDLLGKGDIKLNDSELRFFEVAVHEFGNSKHLYVEVANGKLQSSALVHHGLLLPEERHLCESIFKRPDGVRVLAATSTLAQGMNLPSELVIIAEDSRFDEAKNKREVLEAQELLNAAGRAGRAGQIANGIVLVVPGKVVGFDFKDAKIGTHWTTLQKIFGQSDQCLEIDDPFTALLDKVHTNIDKMGELERYAVARLASTGPGSDDQSRLAAAVNRSLSAYRARKRDDQAWLDDRIEAVTNFHVAQAPENEDEIAERQIAAILGLPFEVVVRLSEAIKTSPPVEGASVSVWRRWFFKLLKENTDLLEKVFRRQSLEDLFGSTFEKLDDITDRAKYALPMLAKLTKLWMAGDPLCNMELALGTKANSLKTCLGARKFVLRIVPELAYLFGLPMLLHQRLKDAASETEVISPALAQLGNCVRLGFDSHEKAALNSYLRNHHLPRRELHERFAEIEAYLEEAEENETWEVALSRIETAVLLELLDRDLL